MRPPSRQATRRTLSTASNSPTSARVAPRRIPVRMNGTLDGSTTEVKRSRRDALKLIAVSRCLRSAAWTRSGDELHFTIEADSFLRHMVRTLVGTMLEIGAGRRDPESLPHLLSGRPRPEAGDTAPAHGLWLIGVRYP